MFRKCRLPESWGGAPPYPLLATLMGPANCLIIGLPYNNSDGIQCPY